MRSSVFCPLWLRFFLAMSLKSFGDATNWETVRLIAEVVLRPDVDTVEEQVVSAGRRIGTL